MFNVGGGELLVIFLVALIVLGPAKLPEAARQVGGAVRELKRLSSGFQQELRAAMDDPVEAAARDRGARIVASEQPSAPVEPEPSEAAAADLDAATADFEDPDDDLDVADLPQVTTAEAAGMYDLVPELDRPRSDTRADDADDAAPAHDRAADDHSNQALADDPDRDAPSADDPVEGDRSPSGDTGGATPA